MLTTGVHSGGVDLVTHAGAYTIVGREFPRGEEVSSRGGDFWKANSRRVIERPQVEGIDQSAFVQVPQIRVQRGVIRVGELRDVETPWIHILRSAQDVQLQFRIKFRSFAQGFLLFVNRAQGDTGRLLHTAVSHSSTQGRATRRVTAALDRLEQAEQVVDKARQKVLGKGAVA